ncbi:hypothetical protein [Poseidonocella sp. HB161398]|uniref:hypothetical protein n=1 Tax=Poseidonocella sp. HB161398 TaxID=2320855 RepID=UPI0011088D9A|nr:hypothetical protein [Poseidonocella sp. HB161398]
MSFVLIDRLEGLSLPADGPLRRDPIVPPEQQSADYLARYDDRTLFYDAVALGPKHVLVTAPAAFNLWDGLRRGFSWEDGSPARLFSRQRLPATELLTFRRRPGALRFRLGQIDRPVRLRESPAAEFAGLNTLVTLSRDNPLPWIREWLDFYVRAHGLEALVFFDNGSEAYPPEAIAETALAAGLKAVAVYQVPFPYGITLRSPDGRRSGILLQPSLLNLMRRDMGAQARAVLNVDIDEIIRTPGDRSIFDLASESWHGMAKVHGSWVYPDPEAELPAPQHLHVRRAIPNARCNQKWCARPNGLLSRFGWSVHFIGERLKSVAHAVPGAELLHCRATTTGWKDTRHRIPEETAADPDLADYFRTWLPHD